MPVDLIHRHSHKGEIHMESSVSIIIPAVFYYVIFTLIRTALGGSANRKRTVDAMIVRKRQSCTQHHHGAEIFTDHEKMNYFITFQFDKNTRVELQVKEYHYDLLFDGERGRLTYRGKKFIRFRET